MSEPALTRSQAKAIIAAIFDLQSRCTRIEQMVESLHAFERDRTETLKHQRHLIEHVMRLMRQKEALLEAVGRTALEAKL